MIWCTKRYLGQYVRVVRPLEVGSLVNSKTNRGLTNSMLGGCIGRKVSTVLLVIILTGCTSLPNPERPPENFRSILPSRVRVLPRSGDVLLDGQRVGSLYDSGLDKARFEISKMEDFKNIHGYSITKVKSGHYLIAGGTGYGPIIQDSSWLYDPATAKLTRGPKLCIPRSDHAGIGLEDGSVLLIGGQTFKPMSKTVKYPQVEMAEIYNPKTNKFMPAANLLDANDADIGSVTLMTDGCVLLICAHSGGAELYDPKKNCFVYAGQMNEIRGGHRGFALRDGRALIYGGTVEPHFWDGWTANPVHLDSAEMYQGR